jgi:hypothetical protein
MIKKTNKGFCQSAYPHKMVAVRGHTPAFKEGDILFGIIRAILVFLWDAVRNLDIGHLGKHEFDFPLPRIHPHPHQVLVTVTPDRIILRPL